MKLPSKLLVSNLVALVAINAAAPCFALAQSDAVNQRLGQIEGELNTNPNPQPQLLQEISKIVQQNPNNGKAHFLAGRVLQRMGFSTLATQEFDKADKLMPQTPDSMLEAFLLKMEQGEPEAAFDYIGYLAKRFPNDPALALTRALLMESKGQKALAEVFLKKALDGKDQRIGVATAVGNIRLRQGDYAEAVRLAQYDLAKNPTYYRAAVLAGEACTKLKRYKEGAGYYKRVYEANANALGDEQINNYATCLFRTEQFLAALDPALMYLAMATKPDVMRKAKYQVYSLMKQTKSTQWMPVINKVEARLEHTIYQGRLDLALGDVFDTLGHRHIAEQFYAQGIVQLPTLGRPYYRLARDFELDGQYEKAKALYEKAYALDPNDKDIAGGFACFVLSRYVNRKNDIAWQLKDLVQKR
jgi:tetratricopeptide (TPR) repeat protein